MVYVVDDSSTNTQVNGIMTTTLERLTSLRISQLVVAAAVAVLFIVAAAGMASADNYGGSGNYPTNPPPAHGQVPPTGSSGSTVSQSSSLPVTGGDALGLAALGVAVVGTGAGLVAWSRRRSGTPVNA